RYIPPHRRLDDEAANAGRAAVYELFADCQLLFRKRDDLLIAVPQCGFMRYRLAYRSRDGTVCIKTKRGGSLVNVDRVMPLKDSSNAIHMLARHPDSQQRRAAFETAIVHGRVVVWLASQKAAPKARPSTRV